MNFLNSCVEQADKPILFKWRWCKYKRCFLLIQSFLLIGTKRWLKCRSNFQPVNSQFRYLFDQLFCYSVLWFEFKSAVAQSYKPSESNMSFNQVMMLNFIRIESTWCDYYCVLDYRGPQPRWGDSLLGIFVLNLNCYLWNVNICETFFCNYLYV